MMHHLGVFIGRFQPFHAGHYNIVVQALEKVERVLLLIGSSYEPRSIRNPWSFDEREAMIRSCFNEVENSRIICEPLVDIRYNDTLWASEVQKAVYLHEADDGHITLVGPDRYGEGYYINFFPQWDHIAIQHDDMSVRGTDIRHSLFGENHPDAMKQDLPNSVFLNLIKFMSTPDGLNLRKEHEFVEKYKKGWESAPFVPTHVTVDAIVIQSGHVLLMRRTAQPGQGLWALPGGFIHHEETLINAMVRKLKEETQIKVPVPVLLGNVKNQVVFDAPFRSDRGRTITHAFHIELRGEEKLPKVKGGSEIDHCFWLPLGQLDSEKMFEDHYFIIQKIVGMI